MKTVAQMSEEAVRLTQYIEGLPEGADITYDTVREELGIKMNTIGKNKLRQAIERCRREYTNIRNVGYQLADPGNSMAILSTRLQRIDQTVKRADKSQVIIYDDFYDRLPPEQQKAVVFLGATFGAIRVAAESGKRVYGRQGTRVLAPAQTLDVMHTT